MPKIKNLKSEYSCFKANSSLALEFQKLKEQAQKQASSKGALKEIVRIVRCRKTCVLRFPDRQPPEAYLITWNHGRLHRKRLKCS